MATASAPSQGATQGLEGTTVREWACKVGSSRWHNDASYVDRPIRLRPGAGRECAITTCRNQYQRSKSGQIVVYGDGGTLVASHTLVHDLDPWHEPLDDPGDLIGDPGFVGDCDHRLAPGSVAIDAGTDAGVRTDLEGRARPQGGGYDLGAYQHPTG